MYRRNKVLNHFTLMVQKRLKNEEEEEIDEDDKTKGKKTAKSRKSKGLKLSYYFDICIAIIHIFWSIVF